MQSLNNGGQNERPEFQENDIFDLILQLWKGKKIILCCVILALGCAITYLAVHKPSWVSTAIVSQPDSGQVANYTNTLLLLYPANQKSDQISGAVLPSIFDIRATAYEHFAEQVSARLALGERDGIVVSDVPNMVKSKPADKTATVPLQFTYTAPSPEQLEDKLRAFIQQINAGVEKQLINDLKANIVLRKQELTDTLAIQDDLAKLPDYTEKSLSTREQLLRIASLTPDKMKIDSFRYLVEPTTAQIQEKKSPAMIVLLSLILGAIVGAGIVLTRNAIRHYQQR